jgi:hypothetical protein
VVSSAFLDGWVPVQSFFLYHHHHQQQQSKDLLATREIDFVVVSVGVTMLNVGPILHTDEAK